MFVVKRDGRKENVNFDKITRRIRKLSYGLNQDFVDPIVISQQVVKGVFKGVKTIQLDELAAETAVSYSSVHMDYAILAARICVSNLHKTTKDRFSDVIQDFHQYTHNGRSGSLISDEVFEFIMDNKQAFNSIIVYDRDYDYDYFGIKTLMKSYLLKINGEIAERPQQMLLRVACGIHCGDVKATVETYEMMSKGYFTHASPTLFNSGTNNPQMSSCFLVKMHSDSIKGIYKTLAWCADISKSAGGIGISITNVRAKNSYIRGTNGVSNGIVPMLRVFNATARYVDQGGGKRRGAFAMYLEPWHADIFDFLDLRKNHGQEELRARDLFYALWVCDLFMQRVEDNAEWSLFCPDEAPGLDRVWGEEFESLYHEYEQKGLAKKTVSARELMRLICKTQIETGMPYMLYKDACNRKSNQKHLGCISSSNLCTEIVQYSSQDEIAVCNLASIALPKFVDMKSRTFDFESLKEVTAVVTKNLNQVIDRNAYPLEETKRSNMRHRPMGIGVQGLADVFAMMHYPYESKEAQILNKQIFECMYYAALSTSCDLAREFGPYPSYEGSPVSNGVLQHDMWGVTVGNDLCDWDTLRLRIAEHGVRNSLLVAPMPTASTSQILGNSTSFEPLKSNAFVRKTMAGEFTCFSRFLVDDLVKLNLWDEKMKNRIIEAKGSIQGFPDIPREIQEIYKTVHEMKGKNLIQMAADRGAFIDQSQSFNVFLKNPKFSTIYNYHRFGWKSGLKTGMYYLRSNAAKDPQQVKQDSIKKEDNEEQPQPSVSTSSPSPDMSDLQECPIDCLSCGS